MPKKKKKKTLRTTKQTELMKKVRKVQPPATKVINPKKYDRKDKSWRDENEE